MLSYRSLARSLPSRRAYAARARGILERLGLEGGATHHAGLYATHAGLYAGEWQAGSGEEYASRCKATGEVLGIVRGATTGETEAIIERAREGYLAWRLVPAPRRGEILRLVRERLAAHRADLGALVSLEMGKIRSEGEGEVQEFVDICDYAVGLSRMMHGTVVPSERANHTLSERPNPLGVVGVISAFNFPNAVFGWNFALSFVSGNATIWAPAPTTPLVSIATTRIVASVLAEQGVPPGVLALACGGPAAGQALAASPLVDLVSFTGSEATGKVVATEVASRLGRSLLELGGNNAAIVLADADVDAVALPSVVFGAIGTAGQRCTTTRRLFLQRDIADDFLERLCAAYASLVPSRMGHPLDDGTLCGPLHSRTALDSFHRTLAAAEAQGGRIAFGGGVHQPADDALHAGAWAEPTIVVHGDGAVPNVMRAECFAPILHVKRFDTLDEAIALNNDTDHGLASTLFTRSLDAAHRWLGPSGSDTGLVNVNTSTSGAEIALPFGGNKSTGSGRESGGDAWRQYSRWSSSVVNTSGSVPLAQGVSFA